MAVPTLKNAPLAGLPHKLVEDKLLTELDARKALKESEKQKTSLVSYLVKNNEKFTNLSTGASITSYEIAFAASEKFKIPLVDISCIKLEEEIVKLIDKDKDVKQHAAQKTIKDYRVIPVFKRGNILFVAVSDPTNLAALDQIKFLTKMRTEAILVEEDKLLKVIETDIEKFFEEQFDFDEDVDLAGEVEVETKDDDDEVKEDDAPVVKFVNAMLFSAIKLGASDLHFEPYEKYYRVRFRVDGILRVFATPPIQIARKLAARIKVMSRLDVSERRVPQDGRIKLKVSSSKSIDFRVSTCPILWGEKIVMRILDSSSANLNIDILGYEEFQKTQYLEALANPYGMVLVTGPTGSGKTVSLYTGINILNKEGVNISTAEDPVEINLPGVNQVQIDEKTGMTFAKALKAFLRQDPDIILVGEIRDLETGGIAIKAATTGHMVMSTLHTNDAPQTLTRMIDMGIAPFAIATAVNLIMAQRLCRRLCSCKVEMDIPENALLEEGFSKEEIPDLKLYQPRKNGCERCNNAGYKGRVGVYQVMPVSDVMSRLIMEGSNAIGIADQARHESIPDLRESGLKKVKDGLTSLEEINRVVSKE